MAEITTVARPYAKAAFQFAKDQGALASWSEMLALVAGIMADDAFDAYVSRPALSSQDQAAALFAAAGESLTPAAKNFLQQMADNKRLAALPAVSALFDELRAQEEGALAVEVIAAFDMSDEQATQLAATLSAKLARQVTVSASVDSALIGGAVIRAGDLVIDASVRGKLGKLNAALITG